MSVSVPAVALMSDSVPVLAMMHFSIRSLVILETLVHAFFVHDDIITPFEAQTTLSAPRYETLVFSSRFSRAPSLQKRFGIARFHHVSTPSGLSGLLDHSHARPV